MTDTLKELRALIYVYRNAVVEESKSLLFEGSSSPRYIDAQDGLAAARSAIEARWKALEEDRDRALFEVAALDRKLAASTGLSQRVECLSQIASQEGN